MSLSTPTETTQMVSQSDPVVNRSSAEKRAAFLAGLLETAQKSQQTNEFVAAEAIATLQGQAAACIRELAIPSSRDEDWRFTDLSKLTESGYNPAQKQSLTVGEIDTLILPEAQQSRIVFLDGLYAPELSNIEAIADYVTVGHGEAVAAKLAEHPERLAKLPGADEVFTTLNTAAFADLLIVQIPKGTALAPPIHILYCSTGLGQLSNPRCLIVAETSSSLSVIEEYCSLVDDSSAFSNAVTEIVLNDNAELNHSRIQRESNEAVHIGKTSVIQSRDSRYTNIAVHIGGALSRHNLEVHHQGEQVESNLHGLAIASGERLVDTHSNIQYNEPHCQSDQLYKAIATDKGRSVFNGRVDVPKKAQKTNAAQLNRNLLLSNRARVDTKPQLEIVADDVKCTHGATVSQLEDNQVFYLQSRGIDRESAQKLLIEAFALEILNQLPSERLRQTLAESVMQLTADAS